MSIKSTGLNIPPIFATHLIVLTVAEKERKSKGKEYMKEEAQEGLAESDKGPYLQEWSSDTPEEEESWGTSRQKLLRMEERGSVKTILTAINQMAVKMTP